MAARLHLRWAAPCLLALACGAPLPGDDAGSELDGGVSTDAGPPVDAGDVTDADAGGGWEAFEGPSPFAGRVVSYTPGEGAGFGADKLPDVVLGPPGGLGSLSGSLDVLSLGREGTIVVELTEVDVVDGAGPDLLVFENPFRGFTETGVVGASLDGETWVEWSCAAADRAGGFPGCAGVTPVSLNAGNFSSPLDPSATGGDAFDLADVGLTRARFVRVRDSGANGYVGNSGGFDLDAVGGVHVEPRAPP